jgi:protein-S-isoprenylcysteine O-methyltransferase Ste14
MESSRRNGIVSVLFVLFGGPAIVLVYVPFWITRFRIPLGEPSWQIVIAAALIVPGLLPALESMKRFVVVGRGTLVPAVPTKHLVVTGMYRYVRNPMYVGILTALAGETLVFRSRDLAVLTVFFWLATHLFVCFYEERTLTRRYGDEYLRFQRHVPRWLPRLRPWNGGET